MRQYWLMKSEPYKYGIDDLKRDGITPWDGVRNYAARNYMRDTVNIGDGVLFYHSNEKPPYVAGTMVVCSEAYPDALQFDPSSDYFDPKSSEEDPRWQLVDVEFVQKFENSVTLPNLKAEPVLEKMELFRLARLSITPVTEAEWIKIHEMAGAEVK